MLWTSCLTCLPGQIFGVSLMSEKAAACPGAREENQGSRWETAPKGFIQAVPAFALKCSLLKQLVLLGGIYLITLGNMQCI